MTQEPTVDEPTALTLTNLNKGGSELQSQKKQSLAKFLNHEASIDQELETLEQIYKETQDKIAFDMKQLQKKVVAHTEPEAVRILDTQIEQERIYLQNQIIQIEMKQIAESITRVTHAKKISADTERKSSFAEMVLEKYGPPIVRKTRHMAQKVTDPSKKRSLSPKSKPLGLQSSQSNGYESIDSDIQMNLNRDNVGFNNRPLLLVKQL